jgi:hypothetical protein
MARSKSKERARQTNKGWYGRIQAAVRLRIVSLHHVSGGTVRHEHYQQTQFSGNEGYFVNAGRLWLLLPIFAHGIFTPVSIAQEQSTLAPLDPNAEISYFIATGSTTSAYRPSDQDLARWALKAWERNAGGVLRFRPADESTALIRVYWVPADFGLYGEMRPIVVDGRRGAEVYIRPNTDGLGEQIGRRARDDALFRDAVVYLTCLHELGHALGLEHTADFSDIMYSFGFGGDIPGFFTRYRDTLDSRADIAGQAGLSSGDLAQLRSLYDLE